MKAVGSSERRVTLARRSVVETESGQCFDQDPPEAEFPDPLENTDIFLFSGPIYRVQADEFLELVQQERRNKRVALVLSTYGGDADAAYAVARSLQACYEHFTVYVFGQCKSAGTILVLGADEIVMSRWGELGPLDIQLLKEDELGLRTSGLDIFDALDALREYAFKLFEYCFLEIKSRSAGTITTRTAAEIATSSPSQ